MFEKKKKAYIVPVARSAAVHAILTALVSINHLLFMIDCLVPWLGLLTQRIGHLLPGLLVDDGELVPSVVVEERHHWFGHLKRATSKREANKETKTKKKSIVRLMTVINKNGFVLREKGRTFNDLWLTWVSGGSVRAKVGIVDAL